MAMDEASWRQLPGFAVLREQGCITQITFRRHVSCNPSYIRRLKLQGKLEGHQGCVNTVSFSPEDSNILVSGSDDLTVKLWAWQTGREICTIDSGHHSNVFQARIVPRYGPPVLVTSANDGQVRAALMCEGGASAMSTCLWLHRGAAHKIAFLDETWAPGTLLSAGEDGAVALMDLRLPMAENCRILACKDSRVSA